MVNWNGEMELNVDKLDDFNWFLHPQRTTSKQRSPFNKDHTIIMAEWHAYLVISVFQITYVIMYDVT